VSAYATCSTCSNNSGHNLATITHFQLGQYQVSALPVGLPVKWSTDLRPAHFPNKPGVLTAQNSMVTSDCSKTNEFLEAYHCPISHCQTFLCLPVGPKTSSQRSCTSSPWPTLPS